MARLRRPPNWFELGLLAQVAAGALIVGLGIGSMPFIEDEIASVSVAERSPGEILNVLPNWDAKDGLYYLLLHAWMRGGDSEAWVRAFSAVAAVAAIPTTAILARRLFGDAVGLVAGFMLAGSMFVVVHAQNARGYALALLLITLATLLFVEAVRNPFRARFLAYGAVSALAVYATPFSAPVLMVHAASLAFLPQARELVRPFALTYAGVLIAVLPLAALVSATGSEQLGWIDERPGLSEVGSVALGMLGAGNRPQAIAYCVLVAVGLFALWGGWMTGKERPQAWRWRRSLVVGWLLVPPVLLFVASQAQPMFMFRFLIPSAPAMAIIAAIGLVALAQRSRGIAVAAAAVVICVSVLARAGLEGRTEAESGEWERAAARTIVGQSRAGDGLGYAPANLRLPIHWHLEREAARGADLPDDFAVAAEAEDVDHVYAREVPSATLVSRLRRYQRVWLVREPGANWHPTPEPMLDTGLFVLRSEYRRVRWHDFEPLRVELYERREQDR